MLYVHLWFRSHTWKLIFLSRSENSCLGICIAIESNLACTYTCSISKAPTSPHLFSFSLPSPLPFSLPVRALFRHLEWRYQDVPWPYVTMPSTDLPNYMLKRINEASVSALFSLSHNILCMYKYINSYYVHM